MNILFTLCGRAGSKGFKNKNLKFLLGLPLSYYSIAAIILFKNSKAAKEHYIDVVVNTDSDDLIEILKKQKQLIFSIIHRNSSLGGDSVSKVAVIKDCLYQMEAMNKVDYDMVVDLDITSPLRTIGDIHNAISKKIHRKDTDVVYSVTNSRRNPYFNMVKQENGYFSKAIHSKYTARQQAPVFYDMNASIYVYSVNALKNKEDNMFFNNKCDAVLMKDTGVLDIDSEEDLELLQVIAKYLFDNSEEFGEIFAEASNMYKAVFVEVNNEIGQAVDNE